MSRRRTTATPKQFSAYIITHSDVPEIEVGEVLIDKGAQLDRVWNWINFDTGVETSATGRRLTRLCPECRVDHSIVGALGHDGECGSDEVRDEGRQVIADAKKRLAAGWGPSPALPSRSRPGGDRIGGAS